MKFVCAGLSKTGTNSLTHALADMGFNAMHYDTKRLTPIVNGADPSPNFRVYDDLDAIADLPAAYFFEELLAAYPESRCILTVRDEDAWWASIHRHFTQRNPLTNPNDFAWKIRSLAYGSAWPNEFVYRKRYKEHNERVQHVVAPERLLVLDITDPGALSRLAEFAGCEVEAGRTFPHVNRADPTEELADMARRIEAVTNAGARIALADGGLWWQGLSLPDREVLNVAEGAPLWGVPPDGAAAEALVSEAIAAGMDYFVLAAPAFWWLEHYTPVRDLLDGFETAHADLRLRIYRLR